MKNLYQIINEEKENRIQKGSWNSVYEERLNRELPVLEQKDYITTFNNLLELRGKGFLKGTVEASLVCYLAGITDVDPVQHGLVFERFLDHSSNYPVISCIQTEEMDEIPYIAQDKKIYVRKAGKAIPKGISALNVSYEDAEIYENIFAKGNTDEVYMFEGEMSKNILRELQPTSFEDLMLAYTFKFLTYVCPVLEMASAKNGKGHSPFPAEIQEVLADILAPTYGYIVYQEQIIEILHCLAGYSYEDATCVYRLMAHRKSTELEKERRTFLLGYKEKGIAGCSNSGFKLKDANDVFDILIEHAPHTFCKSLSASCCAISYKMAWLKYHNN